MRAAAIAAAWILASCAPAGGPTGIPHEDHDDPVLDRYRCENFLDVERTAGTGLEAGLRRSIPPPGTDPTEELHLRVGTEALDILVRRRRRAGVDWEAYHASWIPSRGVRILCGDFMPDTGIGLVSSARRFAGTFTPSWPLAGAGPRRWTGFYDAFIRGGVLALAAGPVSVSLLAGIPALHAARGTLVEGKPVSGLRATGAHGGLAAGASLLVGDPASGGTFAGLEGAASAGPATVVGEISLANGTIGCAWGCSARLGRFRAAAFAFHAPFRSTGSFSYLPGATQRRGATRSGSAAALRARLPGRCFLDASIEQHDWRDGYRSRSDPAARMRLELRRRAGSLLLTLREENGRETDSFPIPPAPVGRGDRHRSAEIAVLAAAGGAVRLRGGLRLVSEGGSSGWLAAAGVRIEPWRGRARIDAGGSRCRSSRGRVVFRLYEPSIPGAYPWRTVSESGIRAYAICSMRFRGLSASAGLSWQDGAGMRGEAGIRCKY